MSENLGLLLHLKYSFTCILQLVIKHRFLCLKAFTLFICSYKFFFFKIVDFLFEVENSFFFFSKSFLNNFSFLITCFNLIFYLLVCKGKLLLEFNTCSFHRQNLTFILIDYRDLLCLLILQFFDLVLFLTNFDLVPL